MAALHVDADGPSVPKPSAVSVTMSSSAQSLVDPSSSHKGPLPLSVLEITAISNAIGRARELRTHIEQEAPHLKDTMSSFLLASPPLETSTRSDLKYALLYLADFLRALIPLVHLKLPSIELDSVGDIRKAAINVANLTCALCSVGRIKSLDLDQMLTKVAKLLLHHKERIVKRLTEPSKAKSLVKGTADALVTLRASLPRRSVRSNRARGGVSKDF